MWEIYLAENRNVKYSKKELENTVVKLNNLKKILNVDGKTAWGIDTKNNKVIVFTSDEKTKEMVLENIEAEKIEFAPGLNITDQVSVGPSKTINNGVGNCTVAFNAKVNTTNVAVTAGHCRQTLNEVWYQGTTNVGTFTKVSGSSSSIDAGYITLNSNGDTSYMDSTTNTPVVGFASASSDYQGFTLIVSAGGTQYPIKVEYTNVTIGTYTNQRLNSFTTSVTTQGGSSGAPVVSRYYETHLKRYEEVVYGIHKGIAQDANGKILEIYGNVSYAFTELGLTSGITSP